MGRGAFESYFRIGLEDTARYAGLLLAPTKGFGLQPKLIFLPRAVFHKCILQQKNEYGKYVACATPGGYVEFLGTEVFKFPEG